MSIVPRMFIHFCPRALASEVPCFLRWGLSIRVVWKSPTYALLPPPSASVAALQYQVCVGPSGYCGASLRLIHSFSPFIVPHRPRGQCLLPSIHRLISMNSSFEYRCWASLRIIILQKRAGIVGSGFQRRATTKCIFRHASVSSTYPCPLVGWSVTLSDFQSLVAQSLYYWEKVI